MLRKFRIDIVSALLIVVIPGCLIWFKGANLLHLHSVEQRAGWIVVLCVVFVAIFSWCSFDASSRSCVKARQIKYWISERLNDLGADEERNAPEGASTKQSIINLKRQLQEKHNWRWRYRDCWLLISGDVNAIDRLAPNLRRDGWAITPHAVLLYGSRPGGDAKADIVDSAWLKQISRLRRRKPIDAMVIVIRSDKNALIKVYRDCGMHQIHSQSRELKWVAPRYILHAAELGGVSELPEAIACTWSKPSKSSVEVALTTLGGRLADQGVIALGESTRQSGLAELSKLIAHQHKILADLVMRFSNSPLRITYKKSTVHGVFFIPSLPLERVGEDQSGEAFASPSYSSFCSHSLPWSNDTWRAIAEHSNNIRGHRLGYSTTNIAVVCIAGLIGLWITGSVVSGISNRKTIMNADIVVNRLHTTQTPVAAILYLDVLQKQIAALEMRQSEGAPWYSRFGLNRDKQLLSAIWPHYAMISNRMLVAPLRSQLEGDLIQRSAMSNQELANGGKDQIKATYAALKTYLMLAAPSHTDATFLIPQWLASGQPMLPAKTQLSIGAWIDLRRRLISFHVGHLAANSRWAISPDEKLVDSAREALIGVIGLQNSTDVLYQAILDDISGKYPALSMQTLLGSTSSRGLFNTDATVPGVFTRAAWDQHISKAIDEAEKHRKVDHDWVLTDGSVNISSAASGSETKENHLKADDVRVANSGAENLKTALRNRYFTDYAGAWETFLNSVQWQSDSTLSGTIDQLNLLADAQRSPLLALFKAISYQAGAGTTVRSLSEDLLNKAQHLIGNNDPDPSKPGAIAVDEAPMAAAFAPLLQLTDSTNVHQAGGDVKPVSSRSAEMSLARYLERVTSVRLKLQQIMMSSDPDAMSRITAQAILQGKTSDIADSRDYANRVGASLGQQWSGFGSAMFERPLEQTWGVVLRPAAASLNATWRSAIVAAWDSAFSGRYPFSHSDNDVSLPELARFLRGDGGLISRFVTTQLAGMLERQGDEWVPTEGVGGAMLSIDPHFLASLNHLTRISNHLFSEGDAQVRFELKPIPTSGVTDMLVMSGTQKLHYFNQREEWQPMAWPGESLTGESRLEWQTDQSGLRAELDANGRFGLIRLLGKADVTQLDSAQYQLTWQADGLGGVLPATPLRLLLRSQAGAGPLEMLTLRNFILPNQIFVPMERNVASIKATASTTTQPL